MKPAPLDPLARHVLRALYELAELDVVAHAGVLGRALDQPAADVARVLLVLDARGLASAARTRLTLLGLAWAARLPALGLAAAPWVAAARQQARAAPAHDLLGVRGAQARPSTGASAALRALADKARAAPVGTGALRRCVGDEQPALQRARRS